MKYFRISLFTLAAVLLLSASPTFIFAETGSPLSVNQPVPPPVDAELLETEIPPMSGGAPYPYPIVYYEPPAPAAPTDPNAPDAPAINVRYGTTQNFGQLGTPQEWINILGNVTGTTSLKYSLNGGPDKTLSIGSDATGNPPRLSGVGDFNIELAVSELNDGANTVVIKASAGGAPTTQTVTVNYDAGNAWPLPYTADWSTMPNLLAGAQPVDGLWAINGGRLETVIPGYDRLVAMGAMTWTDYEVTAPITVNSLTGEGGTQPPSQSSGVGIIVRWSGHIDDDNDPNTQPNLGWRRLGALAWYRWAGPNKAAFEVRGYGGQDITSPQSDQAIEFGVPYVFKLSVQSSSFTGNAASYRFKFWRAGEPEPPQWYMTATGNAGEPAAGSVVLVAHNAMVSWGKVTVKPLPTQGFTINVNQPANGSIIVTPQKATYTYGERVQIRAQGTAGFGLAGWTGDFSGTQNPLEFDITQNITVGANFEAAAQPKLTVTATGQGQVDISPKKSSYLYGELVTLTPQPQLGSIFAGWSGDLSGANNPAVVVMDRTKTIVANFISANADSPISDDFNACALDTSLWTFVNPVGDGSYEMNGTQLLLHVPAGVSHNIWNEGNRSVRVMQPTQNVDFEIVAKFESVVTDRFQMQGILVEQDSNNLLRFEVHHDGTSNKLYVAQFEAGKPKAILTKTLQQSTPSHLRVTRVGSQWSFSYSDDGTTWVSGGSFNQALTVTKSGVFGANHGTSNIPAHTAIVDYFFNTAAPIVPEDGNTLGGFTVTTTKVGEGTVTVSPAKPTYSCGEKVTLTAKPAAGWTFSGWSGDLSGSNPTQELTISRSYAITATFIKQGQGGSYKTYLPMVID